MITDHQLHELRLEAEAALAGPRVEFTSCDPRVMLALLDEIDASRVALLKFPKRQAWANQLVATD